MHAGWLPDKARYRLGVLALPWPKRQTPRCDHAMDPGQSAPTMMVLHRTGKGSAGAMADGDSVGLPCLLGAGKRTKLGKSAGVKRAFGLEPR